MGTEIRRDVHWKPGYRIFPDTGTIFPRGWDLGLHGPPSHRALSVFGPRALSALRFVFGNRNSLGLQLGRPQQDFCHFCGSRQGPYFVMSESESGQLTFPLIKMCPMYWMCSWQGSYSCAGTSVSNRFVAVRVRAVVLNVCSSPLHIILSASRAADCLVVWRTCTHPITCIYLISAQATVLGGSQPWSPTRVHTHTCGWACRMRAVPFRDGAAPARGSRVRPR